jgi:hypothetical protein
VVESVVTVGILLVVDLEGNSISGEDGGGWRVEGESLVVEPKGDIAQAKLDSASAPFDCRNGVFANAEKEEEGHNDEVAYGLALGIRMEGVGAMDGFKDGHREGDLALRGWVDVTEGSEESGEGQV